MKIKRKSWFRHPLSDRNWLEGWVTRLEKLNNKTYERIQLQTSLGTTHIWGLNTNEDHLKTLIIFPGARTTALFWDFENGLDVFENKFRIFMVETNGLPNLSDGATPDIKGTGYGEWAAEVAGQLGVESAYVAGASFGGLVAMKFAITNPEMIKAAFLLNPGCLQSFSMSPKNLYYNLLPIFSPKPENVKLFLDKAVFCKPHHFLSLPYEDLIVEYEVFALTRYKDNTQKPYYMGKELLEVKTDVYLLEGDKDLLFPFQKSIDNASKMLKSLRDVKVFPNVGHGIETHKPALRYIANTISGI